MFSPGSKPEDNVIRIDDRRKVSAKFKAIRIIDIICENMYSLPYQIIMQKQGCSIEPDDIKEAKLSTKMKLMERHIDGRTTKQLSGAISELKKMAIEISEHRRALTVAMPEGIKS